MDIFEQSESFRLLVDSTEKLNSCFKKKFRIYSTIGLYISKQDFN